MIFPGRPPRSGLIQRPSSPAFFDKNHPLARGCTHAYYFLEGAGNNVGNSVDGGNIQFVNLEGSWGPEGALGKIGLFGSVEDPIRNSDACTAIVRCTLTTATDTRFMMGSDGPSFSSLIMRVSAAGDFEVFVRELPGQYLGGSTGFAPTIFEPHTFVLRYDKDVGQLEGFLDGAKSSPIFSNSGILQISSRLMNHVSEFPFIGEMNAILFYSRALTDQEIVEISSNIYFPFGRRSKFSFIPSGASPFDIINQSFIGSSTATEIALPQQVISQSFIGSSTATEIALPEQVISQSFIETTTAEISSGTNNAISASFIEATNAIAFALPSNIINSAFINTVTAGADSATPGDAISSSFIETVTASGGEIFEVGRVASPSILIN